MTFIDNISNIRDKYNQQTKHHLHKKNIVSGRGHRSNTITVRYYVSNYRATTGSVGGWGEGGYITWIVYFKQALCKLFKDV